MQCCLKTLQCTLYVKLTHNIYFNHSYNIEITNLEFIGCGGNQVNHVVQFIVQNIKFDGQEYSGTALELIDTTARMSTVHLYQIKENHIENVSYTIQMMAVLVMDSLVVQLLPLTIQLI